MSRSLTVGASLGDGTRAHSRCGIARLMIAEPGGSSRIFSGGKNSSRRHRRSSSSSSNSSSSSSTGTPHVGGPHVSGVFSLQFWTKLSNWM